MPIYEYRCRSCGHELEKLQRLSDTDLIECPACESSSLQRFISAAAFRLKGSGWYETDFKKGDRRNLSESSGEESDAKTTKADTESKDSKSGLTTDAKSSDSGSKKESKSGGADKSSAVSKKADAA